MLWHLWNYVIKKRIPPQPSLLSRSWVNAAGRKMNIFIAWKRKRRRNSKHKDINVDNGDNSPTVPQEKRVVPLLMVWRSRCGGQASRESARYKIKNKWEHCMFSTPVALGHTWLLVSPVVKVYWVHNSKVLALWLTISIVCYFRKPLHYIWKVDSTLCPTAFIWQV